MANIRHILMICIMLLAFPQLVLASKTHVVRKNESLHSIARKYHVSVEELKTVNTLTGVQIKQGTRLIIPSHAVAKAKKEKAAESPKSYKVVKGDTLPGIAKKTGIKMGTLRSLNNIKGNKIKQGQVLVLNEVVPAAVPKRAVLENRLATINSDLLNEKELANTLAELTDLDADKPVDLAKTLEENESASNTLKKTAYSFLGARYRFGGNSRNALDCSSFTQQVFRDMKIRLPRTAREQFHVGNEVMRGDLKKGDLVFFQTYARFPSHVGIYLGNRKMIHASSRDRRVVISSMDTPYYLGRYLGARRVGDQVDDDNFSALLLGVEEERESEVLQNDTLGLTLSQNN